MGCNKSKQEPSPVEEKSPTSPHLPTPPPPPIQTDVSYVKPTDKLRTPPLTPQQTPKNPDLPPIKRSPDKASPLSKTINVTQPTRLPIPKPNNKLNILTDGLTISESETKTSPERDSAMSGRDSKPSRASFYKTPRIPKTPAFHRKDPLSTSMVSFDFAETPNHSMYSAAPAARRPSLADMGQNNNLSRRKVVLQVLQSDYVTPASKFYAKTDDQTNLIRKAIEESVILKNYEEAQKEAIIQNMYREEYKENELIVKEGDVTSDFVVVEKGEVDVKSTTEDEVYGVSEGGFYGDSIYYIILYYCYCFFLLLLLHLLL